MITLFSATLNPHPRNQTKKKQTDRKFFYAIALCSDTSHQCYLSYLTTCQTAAKVLEGSHQQHGFLSITYTQAVTKNVRHKLTTRPERPTRSSATTASQRVTADLLADSSPQYLREILLTAQPFDMVLSCPLLATVTGVFQVECHITV